MLTSPSPVRWSYLHPLTKLKDIYGMNSMGASHWIFSPRVGTMVGTKAYIVRHLIYLSPKQLDFRGFLCFLCIRRLLKSWAIFLYINDATRSSNLHLSLYIRITLLRFVSPLPINTLIYGIFSFLACSIASSSPLPFSLPPFLPSPTPLLPLKEPRIIEYQILNDFFKLFIPFEGKGQYCL